MNIRPSDVEVTPEALAVFRREVFDKLKEAGSLPTDMPYARWQIDENELRRAYQQVELEGAFDTVFEGDLDGMPSGYWTQERQARNAQHRRAY